MTVQPVPHTWPSLPQRVPEESSAPMGPGREAARPRFSTSSAMRTASCTKSTRSSVPRPTWTAWYGSTASWTATAMTVPSYGAASPGRSLW